MGGHPTPEQAMGACATTIAEKIKAKLRGTVAPRKVFAMDKHLFTIQEETLSDIEVDSEEKREIKDWMAAFINDSDTDEVDVRQFRKWARETQMPRNEEKLLKPDFLLEDWIRDVAASHTSAHTSDCSTADTDSAFREQRPKLRKKCIPKAKVACLRGDEMSVVAPEPETVAHKRRHAVALGAQATSKLTQRVTTDSIKMLADVSAAMPRRRRDAFFLPAVQPSRAPIRPKNVPTRTLKDLAPTPAPADPRIRRVNNTDILQTWMNIM